MATREIKGTPDLHLLQRTVKLWIERQRHDNVSVEEVLCDLIDAIGALDDRLTSLEKRTLTK